MFDDMKCYILRTSDSHNGTHCFAFFIFSKKQNKKYVTSYIFTYASQTIGTNQLWTYLISFNDVYFYGCPRPLETQNKRTTCVRKEI